MPKKAPEKIGSVLRVPLSQLHPHPQNPFAVREDSAMKELEESVRQNGVLVPAIARPRAEGGYELIAGHRRKHACEQAGQDSMPVIVLNLNDDEAVIQLVDSNIQREDILPSERARAYKMKMDAIKRQGARTDLTSPNVSAKFRSDDSVGEKDGISGDTVRNYISLNNLTPPLMQMVDEKKIALTPAYQIAALSEQEQELLVETMSSEQATPSLSQAQRMKKLSQRRFISMSKIEKLHESIRTLFRSEGEKFCYTPGEIERLVCSLNYKQLYSVLYDMAEPVFACCAGGGISDSHQYHSTKLFPANATLIWSDEGEPLGDDTISTSYSNELWLLEDMTIAATSCFRVLDSAASYITEYREYKGDERPAHLVPVNILELWQSLIDKYQDCGDEELDAALKAIIYEP